MWRCLSKGLFLRRPMTASGPGCVKTRSDLVVMRCRARIFAFIRSPCARTPQKSWCAFTAQSFHTAWAKNGSSSRRVSWPLHLQLRKEPAAPVRRAGTRSSAHSADDLSVLGELCTGVRRRLRHHRRAHNCAYDLNHCAATHCPNPSTL